MSAKSDAPMEGAVPADRLAEASVWLARLQDDERPTSTEAGYRQWLRAHPMNARAFELATEAWEDAHILRRVLSFRHEGTRPLVRRGSFKGLFHNPLMSMAVVAVASILLGVGLAFLSRPDSLTTGVGEQRLLVLEDGSQVLLNTATRVVVHYNRRARRVELKAGEALFQVAKRPGWPFIVQVRDRQVTAFGTSFVVRLDTDRTEVTLLDGKVAVAPVESQIASKAQGSEQQKSPGAPSGVETTDSSGQAPGSDSAGVFTLTPGQRLTLQRNKAAELDRPSMDTEIAWRRGQVILNDTPLPAAIDEMNRYNIVKLRTDCPEAATLIVNGLFQIGDSLSFATAVAQNYGLRVVKRQDEILLTRLPQERNKATP